MQRSWELAAWAYGHPIWQGSECSPNCGFVEKRREEHVPRWNCATVVTRGVQQHRVQDEQISLGKGNLDGCSKMSTVVPGNKSEEGPCSHYSSATKWQ